MKKIRRVNVRKFSREMYSFLDKLPLAVYNKVTGKVLFVVISARKGGQLYEFSTEDALQSEKRKS